MNPEEQVQDVPQQEEEEAFACPHCGWRAEDKAKPKEADLKEYVRSILGDRPFSKVYSLYGGEFRIGFTSQDQVNTDRINTLLTEMIKDVENADRLQQIGTKLKLMYYITKLEKGDKTLAFEPPDIDSWLTIEDTFQERFKEINEPLIRVIIKTAFIFFELEQLLVAEAFDENFWKGAGLF